MIKEEDVKVLHANVSSCMSDTLTPDIFYNIVKEELIRYISNKILEIYGSEIKLIRREGEQYTYSLSVPIVLPDKHRNETK